ncbi:hypothetical protein A0H81_10832 [Grifola frondosa]|uniref:Uncharacterized protein n=1 Tax=Grifola frondosa TaxID=5627 RepID=A0A1C7M1Z9_GRIFR|nr:hypothetical protein A0H81_10832 [Grifola frondosa]
MNTGDWWWNLQLTFAKQKLPQGATIAPVILFSDKTHLSQFCGDKSAWLVYLTIGNIVKATRREVSSHATVLIGYLPVRKLDCFSDKTRSAARYCLLHHCMRTILSSMVQAGAQGILMTCPDDFMHSIWSIVATYCLIACCMENWCPMCKVSPTCQGNHEAYPKHDINKTMNLLIKQELKTHDPNSKDKFKSLDLPFSDIFQWFIPDLLHQLHKEVFKDHLVKWCAVIISDEELDARFRVMSQTTELCHFKHGIFTISQWTGHEHKEMEKVFLGLMPSENSIWWELGSAM